MSQTRILKALDRVDRALLAEIDVVQEGRFEDLRTVQQETALAMRALDGTKTGLTLSASDKPVVERAMSRVSKRAEIARGLIGSALNGARDARQRLESLTQSGGEVGTYDRTGGQLRMKTIGSPYNKTI